MAKLKLQSKPIKSTDELMIASECKMKPSLWMSQVGNYCIQTKMNKVPGVRSRIKEHGVFLQGSSTSFIFTGQDTTSTVE